MIGPLVAASDVCDDVETVLRTWLPSVLTAIAAMGKPNLPAPTLYEMPTAEALQNGNAEIPAAVVATAGVTGPPVRDEEGRFRATWRVIVTFYVRGDGYRDTDHNVSTYALAVRAAVMQHPGFASDVTWIGEEYAALESRAARTLGGGFVTFDVTYDDVLDTYGGPLVSDLPPVAGVTVLTTDVTTDLLEEPA